MILDGTLLRIDRVAMASKGGRIYYSGKAKAHGVNVQVLSDPVGRLIWASPALPGARHDAGAAREHDIPNALAAAGIDAFADTAYIGGGPTITAPFRRLRQDRNTHLFRRQELSAGQRPSTRPSRRCAHRASEPTLTSRAGGSCSRSAPAQSTQPYWSTPFES
ncbi:hypothetical protein Kisp01_70550 [Kineosporia sp. NBRC 101677]|nr:transposase family protein [Kineosporia sp. NBRC 101677]GLY20041.1 hypothetical protein Kisp01_70550 [Kineosporia sp. NBRC 101677]